jgi:hypothetical protein
MKFSPLPCYLVPLRPKYSLQHLILKHSKQCIIRKLHLFGRISLIICQTSHYWNWQDVLWIC